MFRRNKADPLVERTALKKCALNQRAGFGQERSITRTAQMDKWLLPLEGNASIVTHELS